MEQEKNKVISIRLIYVILFFVVIIVGTMTGIKYYNNQKTKKIAESNLGIIEQEDAQIASRVEQNKVTSRAEELSRKEDNTSSENNDEVISNETETTLTEENNTVEPKNTSNEEMEKEKGNNYISIREVKISQNMDLTVRTGLSREDFITLMSGVKQDTSGFFKQNAGKIYDLCEEYSLNEIFFCGIISAESGWNIAQNHRNTHNYISLMSNGKLISYSSVDSGLREAARVLHTNYLTKGGKYYYGKTLSAVKTKFCPASSTWVSLVYGRMNQIIK